MSYSGGFNGVSIRNIKAEEKEENLGQLYNFELPEIHISESENHYDFNINVKGKKSNLGVVKILEDKTLPSLKNFCKTFSKGAETGCNDAFIIKKGSLGKSEYLKDVIKGRDITNEGVGKIDKQIIVLNGVLEKNIPKPIKAHLSKFKSKLEGRSKVRSGKLKWYELNSPKTVEFFKKERIVVMQTSDKIIGTIVKDIYTDDTLHNVHLNPEHNHLIDMIHNVIISNEFNEMYEFVTQEEGRTFAQVKKVNVFKVPLPKIFDQADEYKDFQKQLLMDDINVKLTKVDKYTRIDLEVKKGRSGYVGIESRKSSVV
jgi:hypothetical protein